MGLSETPNHGASNTIVRLCECECVRVSRQGHNGGACNIFSCALLIDTKKTTYNVFHIASVRKFVSLYNIGITRWPR